MGSDPKISNSEMKNRHKLIHNPFVHEDDHVLYGADGVCGVDAVSVEPRGGINNWAEEDRPREKMMVKGAEALSEAELLAILIGSGSAKESAVDLMQRILTDHCDSLAALGRMSLEELMSYKGIGEAKAISIMAACELGKRRMKEKVDELPRMGCSSDLFAYFQPRMMDLNVEQCHVLMLDTKHHPIGYKVISTGGIASSPVDVRVVLRQVLLCGATSFVFCHNHPSGSPNPSRDDDALTKRLNEASRAVGLTMTDHIIIGLGRYYSYYDEGKI